MRSELPPDWTTGALGDYVEIVVGFPFKSAGFTDNRQDVRLLRGDNVGQGRLRWNGARHWPVNDCREYPRYELQRGDVVLAMDRPWIEAGLKYAVARNEDLPALLVQRVARLRAREGLNQDFLLYLIAAPRFRSYVQAVQTGTAVPHISAGQIGAFPVVLPPMDEQRRVVSVLGALDDKIESNRRLAALLEETLATVFRARFVDFVGIEEFEESEIGRVPRGWRPGSLTELAAFVNGKAFTKEANGQGRPILRIKELKAGVSDATPWSDVDAPEEHVARHHDILFAWSGSLDVYRWSGPDALINQHIFKVIPRGYPAWFAFEWIRQHMPEFQAIARDKATTMGHIQRRHLSEATVLIPNGDAIAKAREISDPLDRQHSVVAAEIQTLTALRDALLPKLVSGEIRVPDTADTDEAIGAAATRVAA